MIDKSEKTLTGRTPSEPEMQVLPAPDDVVKMSELIERAKAEVSLVTGIDFGALEAVAILTGIRGGKIITLDSYPAINEIRGHSITQIIIDEIIDPTEIMPFVPPKVRGGEVKDPKPHTHLIPQASMSPRRSKRK